METIAAFLLGIVTTAYIMERLYKGRDLFPKRIVKATINQPTELDRAMKSRENVAKSARKIEAFLG